MVLPKVRSDRGRASGLGDPGVVSRAAGMVPPSAYARRAREGPDVDEPW